MKSDMSRVTTGAARRILSSTNLGEKHLKEGCVRRSKSECDKEQLIMRGRVC